MLIPMGTTGEAVTMSAEERFRAIRVAVEEAAGRVPVVAGAGSNSTAETIENVKRAREAGADGTLIVTPYYNKPTQAGLVEHYRAVAKAHPGFPHRRLQRARAAPGVDLLPETALRLCDLPEVVAIKEATGNMARAVDLVEKCGERLTLLSGDDFTVLPFIACGGKGVISVSSNVAPRMMADLVAAARAGDLAKAPGPPGADERAAPAALRRVQPHPGEVGPAQAGTVRTGAAPAARPHDRAQREEAGGRAAQAGPHPGLNPRDASAHGAVRTP